MPVDLTLLSDPKPEVKKFNRWFWGILLLVFILIGSIITIVLSLSYSIPNEQFVSGIIIYPLLAWVLLFLYNYYLYGYRKIYNREWNIHLEARKQELINYAQRGLYVLEHSLVTEYGKFENANKLKENKIVMTKKSHPKSSSPTNHSSLPIPDNCNSDDFCERLKPIFITWKELLDNKLDSIPRDIKLHVRLFIEPTESSDKITELWSKTLGNIVRRPSSFIIENPNKSDTFIESWLDDSDHDHELLLLITARMFYAPADKDGEFASMFLLAGEKIDKKRFLLNDHPFLIKVHRCEKKSTLTQTIDDALHWASNIDSNFDAVWFNGVSYELESIVKDHLNKIEFESENIFNIESSIGYAGCCTYMLGLALAIDNAFLTKNKQLIVIGKPNLVASVVSCLQEENKRSEKNEKV